MNQPPSDDELILIALGEGSAEARKKLDAQSLQRLEELERAVMALETGYRTEEVNDASFELSEFQRERLERARRQLVRGASSPRAFWRRPHAWLPLAAAAAVAFLLLPMAFHDDPTPLGTDLSAPTQATRGGMKSGFLNSHPISETGAQPLAPQGSLHVLAPMQFIWKADPRSRWDLRLYRRGDTEPLAEAKSVSSPVTLEKLTGSTNSPAYWQAEATFVWELRAEGSDEVAPRATFQLAAHAATLNAEDAQAVLAAADLAAEQGRPSESLILLFSIHDQLPVEQFVERRKAREMEILQGQ